MNKARQVIQDLRNMGLLEGSTLEALRGHNPNPAPTIDHHYTNNPVCPYCGYEESDAWEWGDGGEGDGEHECGDCEKPYRYVRYVDINYSTEKMENDDEKR